MESRAKSWKRCWLFCNPSHENHLDLSWYKIPPLCPQLHAGDAVFDDDEGFQAMALTKNSCSLMKFSIFFSFLFSLRLCLTLAVNCTEQADCDYHGCSDVPTRFGFSYKFDCVSRFSTCWWGFIMIHVPLLGGKLFPSNLKPYVWLTPISLLATIFCRAAGTLTLMNIVLLWPVCPLQKVKIILLWNWVMLNVLQLLFISCAKPEGFQDVRPCCWTSQIWWMLSAWPGWFWTTECKSSSSQLSFYFTFCGVSFPSHWLISWQYVKCIQSSLMV